MTTLASSIILIAGRAVASLALYRIPDPALDYAGRRQRAVKRRTDQDQRKRQQTEIAARGRISMMPARRPTRAGSGRRLLATSL